MLAPDDIEPIVNSLKDFYVNLLLADKLAYVAQSFTVHPLSREASWITSLRQKSEYLRNDARNWQISKLAIIPNTLTPFANYKNLFDSVVEYLQQVENGKVAAELLDRLIELIEENIKTTRRAQLSHQDWNAAINLNLVPLDECLKEGWRDLGASEAKVIKLSGEIGQITEKLNNLHGVVGIESISSGTVSSLSNVVVSMASMVYNTAVFGASIPYLSVGMMFLTTGKMFYDIFSTANEVHEQIWKLAKKSLNFTFEEQALAQTKAALIHVYDIKELIGRQQSHLAEMEEFWKSELRNVRTVRNNFALDSKYSKDNPEILQLPVAKSTWFSIKETAQTLIKDINKPVDIRTKIAIG